MIGDTLVLVLVYYGSLFGAMVLDFEFKFKSKTEFFLAVLPFGALIIPMLREWKRLNSKL